MNRSSVANHSALVYDVGWSYPLVVLVLQFARNSFAQCKVCPWTNSLSHKQSLDKVDLLECNPYFDIAKASSCVDHWLMIPEILKVLIMLKPLLTSMS